MIDIGMILNFVCPSVCDEVYLQQKCLNNLTGSAPRTQF